MTKKLLPAFLLCGLFTLPFHTAQAAPTSTDTQPFIQMLENGSYFETIIEPVNDIQQNCSILSATKTTTKTKTTYYKNSSGVVLWSVSITGTFSYDGNSSTCTSCSHSTTSPGTRWSIVSASSDKSGNSATATATARYCNPSTNISQDYTKSITITCDKNGTVS